LSGRSRYILYTVLFLGLITFYGTWVWSSDLGGLGNNAVYLLLAQHFQGGLEAALGARFAASSPHPPLYALVPFPIWKGWHLHVGDYLAQLHADHHPLSALGRQIGSEFHTWVMAWSPGVAVPMLKPPFVVGAAMVAPLGIAGVLRRFPGYL